MKINKKHFHLLIKDGEISCSWDIPKGYKGRYLWLCFSNTKHDERVWGNNKCEHNYHFCLDIPHIIMIDTAHVGKRIFNTRLNLMKLFNKNYTVYSSGDSVQSQC